MVLANKCKISNFSAFPDKFRTVTDKFRSLSLCNLKL